MFTDQQDNSSEANEQLDIDLTQDTGLPIETTYRGTTGDPIFGFLLAIAISIGLTPMLPDNAELRYTLSWLILVGFSILVWLLGTMERIQEEKPENIIWGIAFGFLLSIPLLLFGGDILADATRLMFVDMSVGAVLAYLVFVMPVAESLFFRGVMQHHMHWFVVALLATLWNVIIFFPVFWQDVLIAPVVAMVIATILLMINFLYSYVRERNGLAATWITQIIVNMLIIFLPYL